jgi:hypothetical protein
MAGIRNWALTACVVLGWHTAAIVQTADQVLLNGKIVNVDDRFTIAQTLAIEGERIIAVG